MKPMIIEVNTEDGKVIMTIEEFREHVNDAYREGCIDGSRSKTATPVYAPDD